MMQELAGYPDGLKDGDKADPIPIALLMSAVAYRMQTEAATAPAWLTICWIPLRIRGQVICN